MDSFAATFSLIALAVLLSGALGSLALCKWKMRTLISNGLAVKIVFWIPLWLMYLAVYHGGSAARLLFLSAMIAGAWSEAARVYLKNRSRKSAIFAPVVFTLGIVLFALVTEKAVDPSVFFLTVMAACALSDVCAFFFAKMLGRHHLPWWINSKKYWEGVIGQLIGGVLGIAIARGIGAHELSLSVGLIVGIGSASGDMLNSIAKRQLGITQWSAIIPGHGGGLDRFASVAGAGVMLFILSLVR